MVTAGQTESSQYDHGTPPQHAAGVSPIGSYVSTELGTINLSNGALNFRLPLTSVGGRGFSLPLTLNYSSKVWSGFTGVDVVTDPTYRTYKAAVAVYDSEEAAPDVYQRVAPGWTLGGVPMLRVRGVGISTVSNGPCGSDDYLKALTKLTLILPDKGELELRDDSTDGSPLGALTMAGTNCRWMDGNRGQRWHATDGSGITFISDAANGVINGDLNGWLITAEGMRYRFVDTAPSSGIGSVFLNEFARAASVTDRQGNRVDIAYSINPLAVTYTDQMGRPTTIEFGVTDPSTGETLAVRVTTPGYGGQSHQYKARMGVMNQNYRAGINPTLPVYNGYVAGMAGYENCGDPPPAFTGLFASWCGGAERLDDRTVLTQLVLPDNRTLTFRYNEFGEVAEVVTPTGGKIQYDYAYEAGMPSGNSAAFEINPSPGPGNVAQIDRAVKARRTYPDGVNVEAYWSYEYTATAGVNGSASNGLTEVIARASDNSTVLLRQRHYFLDGARFLDSNGGTGYSLWSTGLERRSETVDAAGSSVISASEQDWSQRSAVVWSYYPSEQTANDNRVDEERKILDNGSMAKVDTVYQANVRYNNPIEVQEFDFDQTLKRRTTTTYADAGNLINGLDYTLDSIHLLSLPLVQTVYDGSGSQKAQTVNEYDIYTNDTNHAPLQDHGTVTQHDASYSASYQTRGNVTRVGQWLNSPSSFIYSYPRYDTLGNLVAAKDPRGNVTTISYTDDFGNGSNPGGGLSGTYGPTYALPTLITTPPPQAGQPQQTARSQYDFSTGLLTGFKDRNGTIIQTVYSDPFDRPTLIKSALGIAGLENHAATYYAPATAFGITLAKNDVMTVKDQSALDDSVLRTWTVTDGFGRTKESWSEDPQGDVKVVTIYDGLARVKQTSNPFRPSLGQTAVYTTTTYDLAGRVVSVKTPDNAIVGTSYSGNTVTVTDQAGKDRQSTTDALGRLTQIIEDPGTGGLAYATTYAYDTLSNLKTVTQGSQTRTFVYDSLSRLTSAANPESGTVTYTYDNNSNLLTKRDARAITTTFTYDALNRVTLKNYSDTTPDVTYTYDSVSVANSKGRLTSVSSTVSTTNYTAYDALGRVTAANQVTDAQTYSLSYAYNLAGRQTSMTYPSGRVITSGYDAAGRLAGVKDQSSGVYYAGAVSTDATNRIQYAAHGAVSVMKLGNGLWEHTNFNNRLQATQIGLGTSSTSSSTMGLTYGYGTTNNNGNVLSVSYSGGGLSYTQNFGYDSLNRLTTSSEGSSWSQTNSYDRYGNRSIVGAALTFNPVNNRITTAGYAYDASGNLTNDTLHTYTFDAESEIKTVDGVTGVYSYDGDGNRVRKNFATGEKVRMVYCGGQLIAEYNLTTGVLQKEYVYGVKGLIATIEPTNGTRYTTSDHLGSPRVVTSSSAVVVSRHDYLPFGEELGAGVGGRTAAQGYSASDNVRQKFTGQQRDDETGLDYFGARYYSSVQGRFTSPDDFLNDTSRIAPASWNLYAYVRNNTTNNIDPNGESTHTDKDGVVLAVYDDKDLSVYTHDDTSKWDKKSTLAREGKGITKMGETEYWDEFRAHDDRTGAVKDSVAQGARIAFGESFDADVRQITNMAKDMDLLELRDAEKPGALFDVKNDKNIAQYGPNTGKLLDGKYATARSLGNYLAGFNGAVSSYFGYQLSEAQFMRLAGALHQEQLGGRVNQARILAGRAYGPAPYYGEIDYAGRRIQAGFRRGLYFRENYENWKWRP